MTINLLMHSPTRATCESSGGHWWVDFHDASGGKFTIFCSPETARSTADAFNAAMDAQKDDGEGDA